MSLSLLDFSRCPELDLTIDTYGAEYMDAWIKFNYLHIYYYHLNNSDNLLNVYWVPGSELGTIQTLSHFHTTTKR